MITLKANLCTCKTIKKTGLVSEGSNWIISLTRSHFEATYLNLQMIVADESQSFKCLACKSPQLLPSLESLRLHFATEHGVVNLLSSAATQAVVPPAGFSRHADSCNPDELFASCRFCGATGFQEDEMKQHLGSRHGLFFQQDWKLYSRKHCR